MQLRAGICVNKNVFFCERSCVVLCSCVLAFAKPSLHTFLGGRQGGAYRYPTQNDYDLTGRTGVCLGIHCLRRGEERLYFLGIVAALEAPSILLLCFCISWLTGRYRCLHSNVWDSVLCFPAWDLSRWPVL